MALGRLLQSRRVSSLPCVAERVGLLGIEVEEPQEVPPTIVEPTVVPGPEEMPPPVDSPDPGLKPPLDLVPGPEEVLEPTVIPGPEDLPPVRLPKPVN